MRVRTCAVLLFALFVAVPAMAQEQRGAIEGIVKDTSGAVLPGAAVEARANTGVVLSTVTDTTGQYRFPSLLPGTYEITATLQGFTSKKQSDVPVSLGQVKKVDFALALASVAETVTVTARIAARRRHAEHAATEHSRRTYRRCCRMAATSPRW